MVNAKLQDRILDSEVTQVNSDDINLTQNVATDISLNLDREDIFDLSRKGKDLVIELSSGEIILIQDFYADNADGKQNRLFVSDDEAIAQVNTTDLNGVEFAEVGAEFEPIVFGHSLGISAPILGALAATGGVALASSGGSDSSSAPATIDAPVIASVTENADGTLDVSGTGEPGSTVTVTFPDGTMGTAPVDAMGNFGPVTSAAPQASGTVTATQADAAGNMSAASSETFTDTSAPAAPTINSSQNPDGTVVVMGTGEPGSVVNITLPDGSTAMTTVDATGNYSVTSANPVNASGNITATQTDVAGNMSAPASNAFTDTVDPATPSATVVGLTNDNTPVISGNATVEPGEILTVDVNGVTYAAGDGNLVDNGDGTFDLTIPAGDALPDGDHDVTVTVTDSSGNAASTTVTDAVTVDATVPAAATIDVAGSSIVSGTAEANSTVQIDFDNDGTIDQTIMADASGNFSVPITPAIEAPIGFLSELNYRGPGEATGEFLEYTVTASDDLSLYVIGIYDGTGSLSSDYSSFFPGRDEITFQDIVNLTGNPGSVGSSVGGIDLSTSVHPTNSDFLIIRLPLTIGDNVAASANNFSTLTRLDTPGGSTGTVLAAWDHGNENPGVTLTGGVAAGAITTPTGEQLSGGPTLQINSNGITTTTTTDGIDSQIVEREVSITVVDAAGNASTTTVSTVDVVPPTSPIVALGDGTAISGTTEANTDVLIDIGQTGTVDATVTSDGAGAWTFTPGTPLGDGDTLSVTTRDDNGNLSEPVDLLFTGSSTITGLAANTVMFNGGDGDEDALVLQPGSSLTLDLTTIDNANIVDVERIDITGDSNNSLVITAQDVLDLSSTSDEVIVLGDAGDNVSASGFTDTGTDRTIDGQVYDVFENGGATLIIDQDVTTTT